jgi:outer membrane protein
MKRIRVPLSLLSALLTFCSTVPAQNKISIQPASGWGIIKPYRQRTVPPPDFNNSGRLENLVRAGKLYLSAPDVVALAIENNLDVEIQRYGPILADEVIRRAQGGGTLRDVTTPVSPGATSVSSTGVANVTTLGSSVSATQGAAVISATGPALPTLDPNLSANISFGHLTNPVSNTFSTIVNAVQTNSHLYNFSYSQGFAAGTNFSLSFNNQRLQQNILTNVLNPSTTSSIDFQISQNLLNGLGLAVNRRYIKVAKNNREVSDLQFKQQLITTISSVLNLYWDLVAFDENVRVAQQALDTAQRLYEDNKKQVQIGTLAPIEVTRAEAEVATDKQNLLVAETNVLQQETILKNSLSKNGVASPTLAEVRIVPVDKIRIPEQESMPEIDKLVTEATQNRPELQQSRLNIESAKASMVGSRNALRPTLQAFAELTNNGLTGSPQFYTSPTTGFQLGPDPYFVGGYGNAIAQIFRRNFPSYSAGFALNIPLRNRANQADYVTDQLTLRQSELQLRKSLNGVRVDVQNAVIGVQQARAGYESSVKARILQQQTLDAEKKKYSLGASTVYQVIQDQRDLATAQGNEVQAEATYVHARIAFDQALGRTLAANNVSLTEALAGKVNRVSSIPENLPTAPEENKPAIPNPSQNASGAGTPDASPNQGR